jgi:hypothetical protein
LCTRVHKTLPQAQILPGKASQLEFVSEQVRVRSTDSASPPTQRPRIPCVTAGNCSHQG